LFRDKTFLILGAAGQDGTLMRKALKNSKIISLSSKLLLSSGNTKEILIRMEKYETTKLTEIFKKHKPDYILNFAGLSSVAECEINTQKSHEFNFQLVNKITQAIMDAKLTDYIFLQCSSSEIFGEGEVYCNEDRQINPITIYGKHKAQAMSFLKTEIKDNLLNLMLFNHESEYRSEIFVTKKIINGIKKYVKTGERVNLGNIYSARDWSYAPDFISGMIKLLEAQRTGDYVFGSGISHTVKEFAMLAMNFERVDSDFNEVFNIDQTFFRTVETPILLADSSKYANEFSALNSINFENMVEVIVLNSSSNNI
jgi:GDPmannose 4,6-dehydratase